MHANVIYGMKQLSCRNPKRTRYDEDSFLSAMGAMRSRVVTTEKMMSHDAQDHQIEL